ncbi:MAG: nucleotidyltransferase [Thermoleophilaceae bacterium]
MTELPDRPVESTEILRVLVRHGVDFVVIGGLAVQTHGHLRTTKDLDLVPEPSRENYVRLAAALAELEAVLRGVDADLLGIDVTDADHLGWGGNFTLVTKHGWLDVFPSDLAKERLRTPSCAGTRSSWRSAATPSRWPDSTTCSP